MGVTKEDWSDKYCKKMNDIKGRCRRIADEEFLKWMSTMSEEDKLLRNKAIDFEDRYFKDMMLETYSKTLNRHEILDRVTGEWISYESKFDFDLSVAKWIIKYDNNLGTAQGMCEGLMRRIRIKSNQIADENIVLLHELIHAFEFNLREACEYYCQYVTLRLYDKLKKREKNLLRLINKDMHRHYIEHSLLFMLKSIDLDIRLKKPLGTVYSYGRTKLYSGRKKWNTEN